MGRLFSLLLVLTIVVCFSSESLAAEHPGEHPGTPAEAEHTEHPGTPTGEHPGTVAEHPGEATLSAGQIIKGIKNHIDKVTEINEGYFPAYDSKEKKGLGLKLIRVHEDRVSYLKTEDAYFACTDFKTADGKTTYDIDFWMRKGKDGKLEVYRTKIHKKDGVPRFTYRDDEIVPVESESMEPEEHIGYMAPEESTY
jgi:hypothetical protein